MTTKIDQDIEQVCRENEHALRRGLHECQEARVIIANKLRDRRSYMTDAEIAEEEAFLRGLDRVITYSVNAISNLPTDPDERLHALEDALAAVKAMPPWLRE